MNRRTFLRRAAIAASAAAVLPTALADPRSIPNPNWVTPPEGEVNGWILNPAWVAAAYEVQWFGYDEKGKRIVWDDPYPMRWENRADCGNPDKCVPIMIPWKIDPIPAPECLQDYQGAVIKWTPSV
jgi:hypothetical protein